jgi:hypothetical protein
MSMSTLESTASLRKILTGALRYWEPRRIPYNAILVLVVIASVIFAWPHSRGIIRFSSLLPLFVLAVIANICYTAAYAADVPVQFSGFRSTWHKWRWLLWSIGTVFAGILAFYWMVDEVIGS